MRRKNSLPQDDILLLHKWRKEIAYMAILLEQVLKSPVGKEEFTINPADGTVWIFRNPDHRRPAFLRHSKDGQDVYFYATTNGDSTISNMLKIGYARLLEEGIKAYVGRWINDRGMIFLDSGTAIDDGMDDVKIVDVLARYNQECATKLEAKHDKKGIITQVRLSMVGNWNEP